MFQTLKPCPVDEPCIEPSFSSQGLSLVLFLHVLVFIHFLPWLIENSNTSLVSTKRSSLYKASGNKVDFIDDLTKRHKTSYHESNTIWIKCQTSKFLNGLLVNPLLRNLHWPLLVNNPLLTTSHWTFCPLIPFNFLCSHVLQIRWNNPFDSSIVSSHFTSSHFLA